MWRGFVGKPDVPWLIAALIAGALLVGALFVPLWRMEMVAPQYPTGLRMYAYGSHFADDPDTYYEDIREINGLNHYIGMKPIQEVTEMDLFMPGVLVTILGLLVVPFVRWRGTLLRALMVVAVWFLPVFFVADLQYWLYHYGHTMDPEAPLNTGSFTPKVMGETHVWNFHANTGFEIGFYLMVAAAIVVTLLPPAIGWLRQRRARAAAMGQAAAQVRQTEGSIAR